MDEKVVLVLQGGGALGAYQAGVYQELAENGQTPIWVSGISIGAINAALIAGNPPARRVERLKAFWERVSSHLVAEPPFGGHDARSLFNDSNASYAALFGVPGMFNPRLPPPFTYPPGSQSALSFYKTSPLRQTLEELVDFDLINKGTTRLAVGAVNVRTGNFAYFDSWDRTIGPEHIMASAALPPGFPPISIDGESYWDGGIVSNTPLQHVLDERPRPDMLVFQVDLFPAQGPLPRTMSDVNEREKDIRYSSRTRLNTDIFRHEQKLRRALARLVDKLPPDFDDDPDAQMVRDLSCNAAITIVHLIHRRKNYFTPSKDYDFSRFSVNEHWECGVEDVRHTFRHKAWRTRQAPDIGVTVLDLAQDED